MKKSIFLVPLLLLLALSSAAQLQTVDGEGTVQASALKRINKKAKYGAHSIQQKISFNTVKGTDGQPVVAAHEKGVVEMTALEKSTVVGYLVAYNQFVKLTDYDFEIYYRNNFRSQKYPPEKVSLTDESIFFDDNYGMFYGFKAEEAGQRSRFKYDYLYTDAKYLTRVFFHEHFPVKEFSISFEIPEWLELDIAEKNFTGYKIKKETKKEKNTNIITYKVENLNAITAEASSLAKPYYLPHLVITVRGYTAGGKKYNGFKSLDDMYAWYNYLYKKANNNTETIKELVTGLVQGKRTDEEKIKTLYYWVQDNIRYIAFEEGYAGFIPQTVQDVYKNKYGDCKGMANLLTEMLKVAGYDAHFAWVGTKEIPYDRKEIQSLCVDNHAITVLYHGGKTYFLDGTEKFAPFGKNAYRIQGKNVLVQAGDTYKVEDVPAAKPEENIMNTKANLVLNGNKITGHVTMTFDGEAKNFFHNIYNAIPANRRKDFINKLLELNNSNTEATNIKTSDFKNRDIPLVLEADIEISNQVTQVEKQCYAGIDFFPGTFTNFIPDADRQSPIDMDHVFMANDEVILELPAKAKALTLPPKFESAFKQNIIEASYTVAANKIILKKKMQLNSPVLYTTDFAEWKSFLSKIKEFNRTNITIQLP